MKPQTLLIVALLCVVILFFMNRMPTSYYEGNHKYCSDKYKNNLEGRVYNENTCNADPKCKSVLSKKGQIKMCTSK